MTPASNLFVSRLYCPNMKPISRPPTPMSPAGTSVCSPMIRHSSTMKLWQKRITSESDFPLGSKSDPPFAPPLVLPGHPEDQLPFRLADPLDDLRLGELRVLDENRA